jgi:hypothetical protein
VMGEATNITVVLRGRPQHGCLEEPAPVKAVGMDISSKIRVATGT